MIALRLRGNWVRFVMAIVATALVSEPALACSVCFGDPNSSMAKGAVAGVLVLVGVVGFVLAGLAGTGLFWLRRSRRIASTDAASQRVDSSTNGTAVP